jgi:hypothetical protein
MPGPRSPSASLFGKTFHPREQDDEAVNARQREGGEGAGDLRWLGKFSPLEFT